MIPDQSLGIIFTIAFPVFALVGLGYFAGRARIMGSDATLALNAFVAAFALPALLFGMLARARVGDILNVEFVIVMGIAMFATQFAVMAYARWVRGSTLAEATLQGLAAGFGNVGYMGIPICIAAFGESGAWPATLTVVIGVAVMMPLCVVLIEVDIHAGRGLRQSLRRVALALVRNPLLIAIVLGIAVAASGVVVPVPVQRFLDLLAAAAGPCALFAIGLFLSDKPLAGGGGDVGFAVAGKLLLQPLLALALVSLFLGLDTMWGKAAILLAALPSAANAFILARQYGRSLLQSSATIFLSTLVSVATVSAVLVALDIGKP